MCRAVDYPPFEDPHNVTLHVDPVDAMFAVVEMAALEERLEAWGRVTASARLRRVREALEAAVYAKAAVG